MRPQVTRLASLGAGVSAVISRPRPVARWPARYAPSPRRAAGRRLLSEEHFNVDGTTLAARVSLKSTCPFILQCFLLLPSRHCCPLLQSRSRVPCP